MNITYILIANAKRVSNFEYAFSMALICHSTIRRCSNLGLVLFDKQPNILSTCLMASKKHKVFYHEESSLQQPDWLFDKSAFAHRVLHLL